MNTSFHTVSTLLKGGEMLFLVLQRLPVFENHEFHIFSLAFPISILEIIGEVVQFVETNYVKNSLVTVKAVKAVI